MNIHNIFLALAMLATVTVGTTGYADTRNASFDVDVEAGFHHDSNVGISDIDSVSGSSDTARKIELGVLAKIPLNELFALRLGYDYADTAYEELSEFDLGLHHGIAEFSLDTAGFVTSLAVERFVAVLDGDEYLEISQLTPSASKLIGNKLYVRAAFTDASKEYDAWMNRDAESESIRMDAYWLIDGMDRYIAVGLQSGKENALDDELDYESFVSILTLGQSLHLSRLPLELKAQVKLENRDYVNATESIQDLRRDDRLRASVGAAVPLSDHFELKAIVEHSNTESNLDSADVDKISYGVSISASF